MTYRSEDYLAWIRRQPSVLDGAGQCVAHHLIGDRYGSAKHSDLFSFPLTNEQHNDLHRIGWRTWEAKFGSQWRFVAKTLETAVLAGFFQRPQALPLQAENSALIPIKASKPRTKVSLRGRKVVARESRTARPKGMLPPRLG